jgi:hypothetical protein
MLPSSMYQKATVAPSVNVLSSNVRNISKASEFDASNVFLKKFCSGEGAIVSDNLEVVKIIKSEKQSNAANNANDKLVIEPIFPLALMSIRFKIVNEIFPYHKAAGDFVTSWLDCKSPLSSLYETAVQHINPQDFIFMRGEHPTIKSMIVSVFNFTLLGTIVDVCDIELFSGPFVSYVREDDDFRSLTQRFGEISGDEEWEKCRLAVVRDKVPFFIAKPSIATHASLLVANHEEEQNFHNTTDSHFDLKNKITTNGEEENNHTTAISENENHNASVPTKASVPSVWSLLTEKYPEYAQSFETTRANIVKKVNLGDSFYPQIGIQRSVTDIVISTRTRRYAGIKIS